LLFVSHALAQAPASVSAQAAQASEPEGYRQAVDDAVREFAAGSFEEARSLFARADMLYPNARTQRGLGLAEFELRNYVECIEHFQVALKSSVKPLDESLRNETEQLLERARAFVGRFVLVTKPTASGITVDGLTSRMRADRTLTLEVGDHKLELYADHYVSEKRMLSVRGGESELLNIDFTRRSALGSAHDSTHWYGSPWLWVAVGVVVTAAATGVIIAATSGNERPGFNGGSSQTVVIAP
jgi:tetratricopeptide (TPR) repeat protein